VDSRGAYQGRAAFFATLLELNYTGDFVIEREAGKQRVADIRTARDVVAKM
jgi:sugar phosphate isomerase/epimerase